ncbi:hypothetical protein [Methanimicrococcus hacksteinii]|uniref:hypothetical protein n=1 Tax=Methanimicrococcus hacksteinii TaxID=3028293 RepID=UPI00298EEA78|nr:hypothetical protein [Methanimicrococcus sp. At1]
MGSAGEIDKAYKKNVGEESSENIYLGSLNDIHICKREMNNKRVNYLRLSLILFLAAVCSACLAVIYFYLKNKQLIGGI